MTPDDRFRALLPLDALLLKGDADPSTRAVMTGALLLQGLPAPDRLRAAFAAATQAVPRMRQRVVTPLPMGLAHWVTDNVDLDYHVRRVGVPAGASLASALGIASAVVNAPLDPARPLWEATVVEGLEGGRSLVLLRAHHAIADGIRALEILAALLELEPDAARPAGPQLLEPPRRRFSLSLSAARGASRQALVSSYDASRAASTLARQLASRPTETLSQGAQYVASVARLFSTSGATPSPVLRDRSRVRRLAALEAPLDELRTSAKSAGCKVNDAYLAALLGGFRIYHEELGEPVADLPLALPIGRPGAMLGGNNFDAAVIRGPASVAEPVERMQLVRDAVTRRRAEPAVDVVTRLAPVLQQLPSSLAVGGITAHGRRVDLQASNLVGAPVPMYLAGERVERIFAFGPLPRVPVMSVLLSYDGTCTIGITLDPAAVTEPSLFIDCLRRGLDEVLEGRARATVAVPPV
jgi:diacylglycerol O-acyltransferase